MADTPKNDFDEPNASASGEAASMDELEAWIIREVSPLEAMLIQFLRVHRCRRSFFGQNIALLNILLADFDFRKTGKIAYDIENVHAASAAMLQASALTTKGALQ